MENGTCIAVIMSSGLAVQTPRGLVLVTAFLNLLVDDFMFDIYFVIVCSSSFLLLMPWKGYSS